MNVMNEEQIGEVLLILQEECAEVTQAVSKVFRFGYDMRYPTESDPSNKEKLEEEIGDLQAMIDILIENSVLSDANINQARHNKKFKLMKWTNIYDTTGTNKVS
jgi:NTP pyrophosphatase (non-canonical NTP hydrolase)